MVPTLFWVKYPYEYSPCYLWLKYVIQALNDVLKDLLSVCATAGCITTPEKRHLIIHFTCEQI